MQITTDTLVRSGLTFRQIDFWCKQGYLTPSNGKTGTGNARTFEPDQLRVALRMRDLVGVGMKPAYAHKLATGDEKLLRKLEMTLSAIRVGLS